MPAHSLNEARSAFVANRIKSAPHETGAGAFWAYSLHIYAQHGVSDACLALQDGAGADVNIALFALWAASRGQRLLPADFTTVEARVRAWRTQVVHPLRAARRALKPLAVTDDARRLYVLVKEAELEAERQQQAMMEPLLPSREPHAADMLAAANLSAYARAAGLRLPDPDLAALTGATRTVPASPG